jgi:hypothetical protein
MRPSTDARLTVELLRAFLRWNESRFAHPNADPDSDSVGWRRGNEWWIKPPTWRSIFEPHGLDPVEAARTLKDSGILRVQDGQNLQAVVKVRDTRVRAYAIDGTALAERRPVTDKRYAGYEAVQLETDRPPISLISAIPDSPPDLAALLEAASRLGLEKAIAILTMQLDPESRHFQTLLRAQTALVSTALTAQVKVDEVRLQSNRRDDVLPALLAKIEAALKEERDAKPR